MENFEFVEDNEFDVYTTDDFLRESGYESMKDFYEDYYGEGCCGENYGY